MPLSVSRARVNSATVNAQHESKRQPVWSWRHAIAKTPVSTGCKALCWAIANYVSDMGTACWPSRQMLMDDSGLSVKQFTKYIAEAEAAGLVRLERKINDKGHLGHYFYHPCFPPHLCLPHKINPDRGGIPATEEEVASSSRLSTSGKPTTQVTIQESNNSPSESRRSATRRAPGSPRKDSPQDKITFKDGKVTLPPELRAEWAPKFGSEEKLDRVLGMIVGKMQPYSARRVSVANQVMGWLHTKLDDHLRDEKRVHWKDKAEADARDMESFWDRLKNKGKHAEGVRP